MNVTALNDAVARTAVKGLRQEFELIQRKVALTALQRLVSRTPVDTGRARANWQVGINSNPGGKIDAAPLPKQAKPRESAPSLTVAGQDTVNKGAATIKDMPLCTCFLTNNVEYIEKLEHGSSKQAPGGMLAVTVNELAEMVK